MSLSLESIQITLEIQIFFLKKGLYIYNTLCLGVQSKPFWNSQHLSTIQSYNYKCVVFQTMLLHSILIASPTYCEVSYWTETRLSLSRQLLHSTSCAIQHLWWITQQKTVAMTLAFLGNARLSHRKERRSPGAGFSPHPWLMDFESVLSDCHQGGY